MNKRKFSFNVPAKILISVDADTEAEAWLKILQQKPVQFSARSSVTEEWFIVSPNYQHSTLLGHECPPDSNTES